MANGALGSGCARSWWRRAAASLFVPADAKVLDVGTGAGALALAVAQQLGPRGRVLGCEANGRMLAAARERVRRARGGSQPAQIELTLADFAALPFADRRFDAATSGFGMLSARDSSLRARELFRVLAPGGRVVLLECTVPDHPLVRALHVGYLGLVFGGMQAPHGAPRAELLSYQARPSMPELLREAGFVGHTLEHAAGGLVCIHAANKPLQRGTEE